MRFLQYLPLLESVGIETTVSPLFSDKYVALLQQGRKVGIEALLGYIGRMRTVLTRRAYDLIWIEKEVLPWLPAWFERLFENGNSPVVFDFDDAVFEIYDLHKNMLVRKALGGKHRRIIRGSELVIAGNEYLAEHLGGAGASHIEILPTAIDLERYPRPAVYERAEMPSRVGIAWIGQRSTADFLEPLRSVFGQLAGDESVRFGAIGIDAGELGLPMESYPWSEQTEVESLKQFDIGIMPLVDGPFERGKCGYKLIQYMACGLPVVASPVGVNSKIVEHGVNGLLADTPQEWSNALNTLIKDEKLRRKMGRAGREKVEREYCIQVTGPRLVELIKSAAGR